MLGQSALAAGVIHHLTMDECPIQIDVVDPAGFQSVESKNIDLIYENPNEAGSRIAFHYFQDPMFNISSFNYITSYVEWLGQEMGCGKERKNTSLQINRNVSQFGFDTLDQQGEFLGCYAYVGELENHVIFSILGISKKSQEEARKNCFLMLEQVYWKRI